MNATNHANNVDDLPTSLGSYVVTGLNLWRTYRVSIRTRPSCLKGLRS
jgi:hypothetical protein